VLTGGRVVRGESKALGEADVVVEDEYETGFVEHATSSPKPGLRDASRRNRNSSLYPITLHGRADHREDPWDRTRSRADHPTAVGGGFGSKLDLSVQPFLALAAWHLNRPVRMVYSPF